jgi:hypothetical protein
MTTRWVAWVRTYSDGEPGGSCSVGGATLEGALANAITLASYYHLSAQDVTIELLEVCATCRNAGIVGTHGHGPRTKRCPACRGKYPTRRVGPVSFRLHPNVVLTASGANQQGGKV